ncbi:MAG TPA: serine/threonine-protein kinase, partial [Polyangia bacterium]|nr:serine/threonine-protein kinase [Polyangia bacterium]
IGGRYRIERFLARGGMGEVYEARDTLLDLRVALKTLSMLISDDTAATARLKNEVQIARRVTHDNVCRLFDLGIHSDGNQGTNGAGGPLVFITMELLDGETLRQRLKRSGRLTPEQASVIVGQLLHGLAAAHRAGVIHRDLKSDNIMLVRAPDGERAVIMDFGLARIRSADWVGSALSTPNTVLGTLAYIAPEQIAGGAATTETDIYSLGVVIYEALTGNLPFRGDTPLSSALMRLGSAPALPSSIVPEIGAVWDSVVMKCLARDPAERFRSVDELSRRLSTADRPASPEVRPGAAPLRGAVKLGGALLLVAAAVFAIFVSVRRVTVSAAGPPPAVQRPSPLAASAPVTASPAAPASTGAPPPPPATAPTPTSSSRASVLGLVTDNPFAEQRDVRSPRQTRKLHRSRQRGRVQTDMTADVPAASATERPAVGEAPVKTSPLAPAPRQPGLNDEIVDPFSRAH